MGTGTGIGRVCGLGSAKAGAHHWWRQRVTAAGNILLLAWFVISLLRLPSLDHDTVVRWIQSPLTEVPLVLLIAYVFCHLRMDLQEEIADYVHGGRRLVEIIELNFNTDGGAAVAIHDVLQIALPGGVACCLMHLR